MSPNFKRFLKSRLSRESALGLHFTVGVILLTLATYVFDYLARNIVGEQPLTITDVRFSNWLHSHATPWLTKVMLVITNLHSTLGITILTIPIAAYMWRARFRRRLIGLLVMIYGGMLLNVWLKAVFQRARPHFDNPLLVVDSYSFPSGHTMAATVFYGALAAIIFTRVTDWRWRCVVVCGATFMIALVGFTRIYLGVHYLTDVAAAMIEGAAWLTISLTAFQTGKRAWHGLPARGSSPK